MDTVLRGCIADVDRLEGTVDVLIDSVAGTDPDSAGIGDHVTVIDPTQGKLGTGECVLVAWLMDRPDRAVPLDGAVALCLDSPSFTLPAREAIALMMLEYDECVDAMYASGLPEATDCQDDESGTGCQCALARVPHARDGTQSCICLALAALVRAARVRRVGRPRAGAAAPPVPASLSAS